MKRRNFLMSTGALAGAGLMSGVSVSRGAQIKGDDLIKIAMVGCGGRNRGAIRERLNVGDNVKLVAICDAFEPNAKSCYDMLNDLKAQYGDKIAIPKDNVFFGFDSYKKAIDCCDQVLIATTPAFRPIHYRYAVEKGKHVFMEKPCCVDAPGFRSLMETNKMADEKGLVVVVGLQRHYSKAYNACFDQVKSGTIGDLMYARVYWNGGGIWERPRQEGDTEMMYQMRNWYHFNWLSGDNICEQHVHNLDVGNWFLTKGDPKAHPVKANGMGGRQCRKFPAFKNSGYRWDHFTVEFTYDNGAQMFSQCKHQDKTWSAVREDFVGTKGYGGIHNLYERGSGKELWKFAGKDVSHTQEEHVQGVKFIREGQKVNNGWYAAVSSFIACFGRMAAMSGQEITWDDAVAKGKAEFPLDKALSWETNPPIMPDKNPPAQPAPGEFIYEESVPIPGIWKWSM